MTLAICALALVVGLCGMLIYTTFSSHRSIVLEHKAKEVAQADLLELAQAGRMVLWSCAPDGSNLSLSGALHLFGTSNVSQPTTLEGIKHLLQPSSQAAFEGACRGLLTGSSEELEVEFATPPDPWVAKAMVQCSSEGLRGYFRDITREVRMQAQLIQAQRRDAVASLVAGVSHEFGNVLSGVDSCAAILTGQPLPESAQKAAELIQSSSQRGRNIIRQLLNVSRPISPQLGPSNLIQILDELVALLKRLFPSRIRIEVSLPNNAPEMSLDSALLHQALLNICINARDAMPHGGRLHISLLVAEKYAQLDLRDSGMGMPPHLLEKVFDPFFTTKENGQGTGLGLSISRDIIERMGGSIRLQSQPGEGTCVSILFPCS